MSASWTCSPVLERAELNEEDRCLWFRPNSSNLTGPWEIILTVGKDDHNLN